MASGNAPDVHSALRGMRVLVVEENESVMHDLLEVLDQLGAVVVEASPDLDRAEHLAADGKELDFTLLDVRLPSQRIARLAERLTADGTRYGYVTGYGRDLIPPHLQGAPVLARPFTPDAAADLLSGRAAEAGPLGGVFANRLLRAFPASVLDRLRPHLVLVPLLPRRSLVSADMPVRRVYFPESGILSLMLGPRTAPVEVGHVGPEGVVGAWAMVDRTSPFDVIVHSPGLAVSIDTDRLLEAIAPDESVRDRLRKFEHVLSIQIACGAVANASDKLEARLARWLLMCADRIGPRLGVVHEFAALMLNVRRAGVTTAIHVLEGEHTIRAGRSSIEIIDRERLESLASRVYGIPERAYDRLLNTDRLPR